MRSPTLPAIYALHLADLIEQRFSVPKNALWKERPEPDARLSVSEYEALILRAHVLAKEPALSVYYGLQMRVSAHGYLGFAAMTARTLGASLDLVQRFTPTRTTALSLRLEDDYSVDEVALTIDEHADFGKARGPVLFALIIGLWKIADDLTGRELTGRCEIACEEPAHFDRFVHLFPTRPEFGAPATRVIFARDLLDAPLVRADLEAQRLARAECERELDRLFADDEPARVRALLPRPHGGFHGEDEVAKRLAMSARTLKRRLAEHGTTFTALLEEARTRRAITLLADVRRGVEAVALDLGYSDAANFSRAFKRWTNESPGRFRKRAQG